MRFKEIIMAYIYESIQPGLFNFSIPGQDKTVQLFKGSRVTVENKLAGGLLRVLKLVGETETVVEETPVKETTKQKAKVADKITKVEEVVETPVETAEVKTEDAVTAVKEEETTVVEETPVETTTKPAPRGKRKSTK